MNCAAGAEAAAGMGWREGSGRGGWAARLLCSAVGVLAARKPAQGAAAPHLGQLVRHGACCAAHLAAWWPPTAAATAGARSGSGGRQRRRPAGAAVVLEDRFSSYLVPARAADRRAGAQERGNAVHAQVRAAVAVCGRGWRVERAAGMMMNADQCWAEAGRPFEHGDGACMSGEQGDNRPRQNDRLGTNKHLKVAGGSMGP